MSVEARKIGDGFEVSVEQANDTVFGLTSTSYARGITKVWKAAGVGMVEIKQSGQVAKAPDTASRGVWR